MRERTQQRQFEILLAVLLLTSWGCSPQKMILKIVVPKIKEMITKKSEVTEDSQGSQVSSLQNAEVNN